MKLQLPSGQPLPRVQPRVRLSVLCMDDPVVSLRSILAAGRPLAAVAVCSGQEPLPSGPEASHWSDRQKNSRLARTAN